MGGLVTLEARRLDYQPGGGGGTLGREGGGRICLHHLAPYLKEALLVNCVASPSVTLIVWQKLAIYH